ncbi:sigma-E factor negative regulatory protein [Fontimonas sp. SYSU GA230001]|uniref:sigma-E factor negative regulatory protein n=1 Tax=Fontimonas sp. SYSU GA230001 TaxID=3142450 RepID=UPI0032B49CB6
MAKDSLSALLDGECTASELDRILDELDRSDELKASWTRLCMARDVLEGVRIRRPAADLCTGVMARLDERPASVTGRVTPLVRPRARTYWKPLAGLAAAASVAAIAVSLNLRPAESGGSPSFLGVPQVAGEVSLPPAQRRPRELLSVALDSDAAAQARRGTIPDELRDYLIEHSNTLANRGMGATLSYARFAAHSVSEPAAMPVSAELSGEPR